MVIGDEAGRYAVFQNTREQCFYAPLGADGALEREPIPLDVRFSCVQSSSSRLGDGIILLARYTGGTEAIPGQVRTLPVATTTADFELPGFEGVGVVSTRDGYIGATLNPPLLQTYTVDLEGRVEEHRLAYSSPQEPIAAELLNPNAVIVVSRESRAGDIAVHHVTTGGAMDSVGLPGMLVEVSAVSSTGGSPPITAVGWRDWRMAKHRVFLLWKTEAGWEAHDIHEGMEPVNVTVSAMSTGDAIVVWSAGQELWSAVVTCS